MARRIVGLDLGAYSVKLVRLESGTHDAPFEVLDAAEEVLPSDNGDVPLKERQQAALSEMFRKGLLDGEIYAVGLPGADGQMRSMKVPFADVRKIEAVLPGLLEAETPFEIDDMVISWHLEEKPHDAPAQDESSQSTIRLVFGKKDS